MLIPRNLSGCDGSWWLTIARAFVCWLTRTGPALGVRRSWVGGCCVVEIEPILLFPSHPKPLVHTKNPPVFVLNKTPALKCTNKTPVLY